VKNSTPSIFYKKPRRNQSKTCTPGCSEQIGIVHDSPGTMIGIEECESDGQVITQLDFSWGVKGECSLA
jgi:hypothetical protein